jgi:topoisomerase-4 subunit A
VQVDAILNLRLKSLSRLEEQEIKAEHSALTKERRELKQLLKDDVLQWERIAEEVRKTRETYGKKTALGRRRTTFADAPAIDIDVETALIEKEPITVILSDKGWIRAQKGHLPPETEYRFKEGDALKLVLHAETTDRIVLFASNGKAYTLRAETLPRGRGDGQPVRLLVELTTEDDIVDCHVHRDGAQFLVAARDGRGFVVKAEDLLAEKRTGKQVLNLEPGGRAALCVPAEGDLVAVIGDNRKLLVFPLEQVPVLARGRGVLLQAYRDGGLADAKVFRGAEGLSWWLGDRVRVEQDVAPWRGQRAGAGRLPPNGFPRSNRFS